MCYEYWERTQRLEERRRRELIDQRRKTERDTQRTTLEELDWAAPEEPARTLDEKVPA
jgi:hypothetical protein